MGAWNSWKPRKTKKMTMEKYEQPFEDVSPNYKWWIFHYFRGGMYKVYEIIPHHMVTCIYKIYINIYVDILKCKKHHPLYHRKLRKNSQPKSFFVLRVCFRLVSDGWLAPTKTHRGKRPHVFSGRVTALPVPGNSPPPKKKHGIGWKRRVFNMALSWRPKFAV